MNNDAINSLRTFAIANNEIEFAHLCTAAMAGEEWAVERVQDTLSAIAKMTEFGSRQPEIKAIRMTDATRPDGAVAKGALKP